MDGGIDPLDAYMESINAEVASLASSKSGTASKLDSLPAISNKSVPEEDTDDHYREPEDTVDVDALKNLTAEELMA